MPTKVVTFALQGGGSHGAFTWGVLDRLLEDERIEIDGISGASAGAMNAVVLVHGFTCDGREGARQALKDFWQGVATKAPFDAMAENPSTPASNESPGRAAPGVPENSPTVGSRSNGRLQRVIIIAPRRQCRASLQSLS